MSFFRKLFSPITKAFASALRPIRDALASLVKIFFDTLFKVFPVDKVAQGLVAIVDAIWAPLAGVSPFREIALAVKAAIWLLVCVVRIFASGDPMKLVWLALCVFLEAAKFLAGLLMSMGSDDYTVGSVVLCALMQSGFAAVYLFMAFASAMALLPLVMALLVALVVDLCIASSPASHFNFSISRDVVYRLFSSSENHPDEWWKRSGDADDNKFERMFLLNLRPCGARRRPDPDRRHKCVDIDPSVPSQCPSAILYRILRKGDRVSSRDLMPAWLAHDLSEAEAHAEYRDRCRSGGPARYDFVSRGMCRELASSTLDTITMRNAARLCLSEFCASGTSEPFCASLQRDGGCPSQIEDLPGLTEVRKTVEAARVHEGIVLAILFATVLSSAFYLTLSNNPLKQLIRARMRL